MSQTKIIQIDASRWQEFKNLRLEALKVEPLAFGEEYEEIVGKSENYWKKELNNKLHQYYFALIGGRLVAMGMVKFVQMKKFSHITRFSGIFVLLEYRGKGIASTLYEEIIKNTFANPEVEKIKLIVNTTQAAAVNLYKKFGFKIVGTLKKEFKIGGNYFDAYQMERLR